MTINHERNGCALHGATRLLQAIDGVVPILHANAGCGVAGRWSAETLSPGGGARSLGHHEISGTNLQEKQVVFGGTARLREQIKNTIKVVRGDLYVVVTGCVPEVVGDDVPAMVKEAREQRFPVITVAAPGFKGTAWSGHALAARILLEQLDSLPVENAAPVEAGDPAPLVNIFGPVPGLDTGWEGDLLEIESLLKELGLRANRLIGYGQDLASWRRAGTAALSLVLSPWGSDAAAVLRDRHQVPVVDPGWLPVGSRDAGELLERVGVALALPRERIATVRRGLDDRLRYFLRKAAGEFLLQDAQKRTVVVGGSASAVGLARFLAGTLGQVVEQVVITDQPPEELHAALTAAVQAVAPAAAVVFRSSRAEIAAGILAARPELVLGSALEQDTARSIGAAFIASATPAVHRPVLRHSHAGVTGALTLVEDLFAALQATRFPSDARVAIGHPVTTPVGNTTDPPNH